jgi:hypothetical protein
MNSPGGIVSTDVKVGTMGAVSKSLGKAPSIDEKIGPFKGMYDAPEGGVPTMGPTSAAKEEQPDTAKLAELNSPPPDDITLTFGPNANESAVSATSRSVIKDILRTAGIRNATITSTARTPEDQARAMYDNLESQGVQAQRTLYGPAGDQVIDVYEKEKKAKKTPEGIKSAMEAKIIELGPSTVSHHCVDLNVLNVVDIAPSSIPANKKQAFITAVEAESRKSKFLQPPSDPAYHIEIPQ